MELLEIELKPTWCNRWPELSVVFNEQNIFTDSITNTCKLQFELPSQNTNCLTIGMNNKHFGQNNTWDTKVDENGNITEDLTLDIVDIWIQQVSVKDILIKNQYKVADVPGQDHLPTQIFSDGCMHYNGYFVFEYTMPVLNSVIDQKHKLPLDDEKSYFSNYTTLFHYEKDLIAIAEIQDILDEIKKFDS